MSNDNGNGGGPPVIPIPHGIFADELNRPVFVWRLSYGPKGISLEGPENQQALLDAVGKLLTALAQRKQEVPRVLPAGAEALRVLARRPL